MRANCINQSSLGCACFVVTPRPTGVVTRLSQGVIRAGWTDRPAPSTLSLSATNRRLTGGCFIVTVFDVLVCGIVILVVLCTLRAALLTGRSSVTVWTSVFVLLLTDAILFVSVFLFISHYPRLSFYCIIPMYPPPQNSEYNKG